MCVKVDYSTEAKKNPRPNAPTKLIETPKDPTTKERYWDEELRAWVKDIIIIPRKHKDLY